MESVTGKPLVRAALEGSWRREEWIGFNLGLLTLASLAVADAALDRSAILVGSFVAAPFVTALFARTSVTAIVGIGALVLAASANEWHSDDLGSAHWLALAIVVIGTMFAVASAWNRQRSRFRGERLRILDAIAAIADGSGPLDEVLEQVTELIVPRIADICMIDAIHPGGVTRAAARVAGHPRAEEIEARVRRRPPSLPAWLVNGERHWRHIPRWRPRLREEEVRRMARSPDDLEFLLSLGIQSQLTVPITARDHTLGALTLLSAWSRRSYTEDDVRFAQIAARRIGLALDNAGLFSDLESVERRMDTVMSILDEAVLIHAREGELVFANPAAAITLGFDDPEDLVATSADRLDARFALRDDSGRTVGWSDLISGRDESGERAPSRTLRLTDLESGREGWYRVKSRVIPGPDGSALYLVTALEDVTDVKRAEFAQGLLARTGELLASSTDHRRTLDGVARLVVPEFADGCTVHVPAPGGRLEEVAAAWVDPDPGDPDRGPAGNGDEAGAGLDPGPLATALHSRRPRLIQIPARAEAAAGGRGSAIIVPMSTAGRVVGVLSFVNDPGSRCFDAGDLGIASELGRRAGLAIENARIAGERAHVAEVLQRELMPPDLPAMRGWDVATMYRPAGEVSEVGGDFYEAFPASGGWAVVLGDVTGHGALAASLTAVARHTIRTAMTLRADPATALGVLDERLRERDAVALCSVAILVLPEVQEGEEAEVAVWLAGHPPPLVLSRGELQEIGAPGPLVGIGERPGWVAEIVALEPGDELIVYTDGVTEASRPGGDRFGIERLRRRLRAGGDPRSTVLGVESALARFSADDPDDDATLVAIRREPRPGARPGTGAPAAEAAPTR